MVNAGTTVRVFVAGGSALLVTSLAALLEILPRVVIVGTEANVSTQLCSASAANGVMQRLRRAHPDVVLLAMLHAERFMLDAARALVENCPGCRLLALVEHPSLTYCRGLLRAGASGYLVPGFGKEDLSRAIVMTAAGGLYLDPQLARRNHVEPASPPTAAKELSTREAEVLRLIAQGHSNKSIAEALDLSTKTVETYKSRGMEKLALRTKVDIVRYAATEGWIA